MISVINSASTALAEIFNGIEEYAGACKDTGSLARTETKKLIAEANCNYVETEIKPIEMINKQH